MEAVDERTIARVNHLFFYSHILRKAVAEAREQQESRNNSPSGGNGHAHISDPTAIAAVKRATPLKMVSITTPQFGDEKVSRPESWLRVIDKTFGCYKSLLAGECMRDRYVKHEKPETIMTKRGIGRTTYYAWRDEFLRDAVLLAVNEGLVYPKEV